jgi:hypothetical protein
VGPGSPCPRDPAPGLGRGAMAPDSGRGTCAR